jgi:hypothetical protein
VNSAETMIRSAEEMLAISNEQGYPQWFGAATMIRGLALSALGHAAEIITRSGVGTPVNQTVSALRFFVTLGTPTSRSTRRSWTSPTSCRLF